MVKSVFDASRPVSRRRLVADLRTLLGLLALPSGLFAGCKTRHLGESGLLAAGDLSPSALEFLKAAAPILSAGSGASSDWQGDSMNVGHATIRDATGGAHAVTRRERAELVIIGGGMSGLGVGYLMRGRRPVILELNDNFGGNSRGEEWNGVSYSIGAAYLVPPAGDHPLMEHFYGPLRVAEDWRKTDEGMVIADGKIVDGFWTGATTSDAAAKQQLKTLREYLVSVAESAAGVPEIPPIDPRAAWSQDVLAWDREPFLAHLEQRCGRLTQPARVFLEHYCWSSFGAAPAAISTAAGLNFLAGEVDGVAAMPGGNSQVALRLLKGILASGVPESNLRVRTAVRSVAIKGDHVEVLCVAPDGSAYTIEADRVVVGCAKFLASYLVQGIPDDQKLAMSQLSYNAYVVANLLVKGTMPRDQYDLYMLDNLAHLTGARGAPSEITDNRNETFEDVVAAADQQRVTDIILGHWAQSKTAPAADSVLTLYRGLPYRSGRSRLHSDAAFERFKAEFSEQVPGILRTLGIDEGRVQHLRMARFGHPLVTAAPGLLAEGTAQRASRSIGNRIFFSNQDNWGLPCIESALGTAIHTAAALEG